MASCHISAARLRLGDLLWRSIGYFPTISGRLISQPAERILKRPWMLGPRHLTAFAHDTVM